MKHFSGYRRRRRVMDINMAPLIDMIFILLIFFLVGARFTADTAVPVRSPQAFSARHVEQRNLRIAVTKQGVIHVQGRAADIRTVKQRVRRFLTANPGGSILIDADTHADAGIVVQVLDRCRLAGAEKVGLAADIPE